MKGNYLKLFILFMAIGSLILFGTIVSIVNFSAEAQSPKENYFMQQGDKWLDRTNNSASLILAERRANIARAFYLRVLVGK